MIQILRTICLKCACHLFLHFLSSWYGRRRKPPLYDSTADVLRQNAFHFLFVHLAPSPDTLDSTVAPVRSPFPFHPQAKYARVRPHRHSDKLQLGKDRGVALRLQHKIVGRGMGAQPVVGHRDRFSDSSGQGMYATLVQDQGPKVRLLPEPPYPLLTPISRPHSHLNNPMPEQAFLAKTMMRARRLQTVRHIPHPRIRIHSGRCGPRWALGLVVIRASVSALVETEGGHGCCWYDSCCKCRCGCE